MKTMTKMLIGLGIFLLIFVIVMLVFYYLTGGIPDTLCTCVFAACTGECGFMGWIKTTKDRHGCMNPEKMQITEEEAEG